jgi:UDP-3-O-[3-hydroxymyristoyl] glucosamine N-acyltransferase
MNLTAKAIYDTFQSQGIFESIEGDPSTSIQEISPIEKGKSGSLVFFDNKKFIDYIKSNKPSIVVANPSLKDQLTPIGIPTIIYSKNVNLSQALLKQKYMDRNLHDSPWGKIHSSAVVHESVKIPSSTVIGPNVVIYPGVKLGENVVVSAGSVIEENAEIGDDTIIHPNVVIGYSCIIGKRVIIKSGSIIGGEGYGFAQDSKKVSYRIPQTGIVIIEDDVMIGGNNCIDRAAYEETRIGRGTKFDNLCHVAHNVQIGQDCLLTAGFIVAGSTKIGNRIIASGQVGILDHLSVADDTILVHRAGVTDSITEPGVYAALPAQPLSSYMKNMVVFRKLAELKGEVKDLQKKLPKE